MKLDYYAMWKLMADLIRDLKRSGESIPPRIMKDLRSAKTMMEIAKVDMSNLQVIMRIEEYLNNLETYLLPLARERFGQAYVDLLMNKIAEAQRRMFKPEHIKERRFPVGVPRDKHWVRIKPTSEMPSNIIKQIAGELELRCDVQEDGYLLVYGGRDEIKEFVKRTARRMQTSGTSD
jgi:hypothetical protein